MSRTHITAALLVLASIAALLAYRHSFIEPREWAAACVAASPPPACVPRAAFLWLQHFYLWGAGALALGLWAFIGAPLAISAAGVALGAAAVINYNATWGMIGLALSAWAWVRFLPVRRTATP